jgi:hypothetical protein
VCEIIPHPRLCGPCACPKRWGPRLCPKPYNSSVAVTEHMKTWSTVYILLAVAGLPQGYWGGLFLAATILPILAANVWPVRDVTSSLLLVSCFAVIAAEVLFCIGGLRLKFRGLDDHATHMLLAATTCYLVFVITRSLTFFRMGAYPSLSFGFPSLLIAFVAIFGAVRLLIHRSTSTRP